MGAVYRHELSSHFSGLTGFVFGAFLLLFCGIFTVYYNIQQAYANFELALGNTYMALVYVIAIPILTMRTIAEERKQKTDLLLYSLPLSMTQVVLGKYLAMLTVLVIPTVIMALYPVLLGAYGAMNLSIALCVLFGFFLLGAALLAMGLFVSALTESQAVSAGLCFVVMLANYFIYDLASMVGNTPFASYGAFAVALAVLCYPVYRFIKNETVCMLLGGLAEGILLICYQAEPSRFSGAFGKLIGKLSLFERFYDFVLGILDVKSILYLASVCVLFVVLTVQTMEKRRWSE